MVLIFWWIPKYKRETWSYFLEVMYLWYVEDSKSHMSSGARLCDIDCERNTYSQEGRAIVGWGGWKKLPGGVEGDFVQDFILLGLEIYCWVCYSLNACGSILLPSSPHAAESMKLALTTLDLLHTRSSPSLLYLRKQNPSRPGILLDCLRSPHLPSHPSPRLRSTLPPPPARLSPFPPHLPIQATIFYHRELPHGSRFCPLPSASSLHMTAWVCQI